MTSRPRYLATKSLQGLVLFSALLAGFSATTAEARHHFGSKWHYYSGQRAYGISYHRRPHQSSRYRSHYVYHYRSQPKYYYYYSPYRWKYYYRSHGRTYYKWYNRGYYGRCRISTGKYAYLDNGYDRPIGQIPDSSFGPMMSRGFIPERTDGIMDVPPPPPGAGGPPTTLTTLDSGFDFNLDSSDDLDLGTFASASLDSSPTPILGDIDLDRVDSKPAITTVFSERDVRVKNSSGDKIQVRVKYLTKKNGSWTWVSPSGYWEISPGESKFLDDDGFRVRGRAVKIWANSPDGKYKWTDYKETPKYFDAYSSPDRLEWEHTLSL